MLINLFVSLYQIKNKCESLILYLIINHSFNHWISGFNLWFYDRNNLEMSTIGYMKYVMSWNCSNSKFVR